MTKLMHPFILSVIIVSVLVSCSFPANDTKTALAQATPILPGGSTIELVVQADTSVPFNAVGQIIKYNYNVKNIGSTPVPGPVSLPGTTCPEVNTVGNKDTALDLNEILVCASAYTITQDDLNRGSVTTVSMATINGINSNQVTTTVVTTPPAILKLTKTASPLNYDHVGQTITYTYIITNGGTATLGPVQFTVTDAAFGTPINCGEATTTLAPNATVTCSAIYTITQANMDSGSTATSATAAGGGVAPSQPASATVTKGATVQSNQTLTVGSTIKHQVVEGEWLWQIARCYGADPNKVSAANPPTPAQISPNTTVIVPNIGSTGKIYGPPCVGIHTVQNGDTWSSIALKYNADVTVLQMVNSNTMPVGKVLKVPLNSAGTVPPPAITPATKALAITTTANPPPYGQLSQVIVFSYIIKNSGTETLGPAQFTVTDTLISTTPINCGAANTSLAPNATVTCSANYTITQSNLDSASISNSVTASGGGVGPSPSTTTTVNKSVAAALTLITVANPATYNQVGQVITFSYAVKNNSNAALGPAQFTVTDSLIGTAPINCGPANTSLAPNAAVTCTATYTITQDDLSETSISNFATASGGGAPPSQSASSTIIKQ